MRALGGNEAPSWQTPQQGAATSALVAVSPLLDGIGGKDIGDCDEALPTCLVPAPV